MSDQPPDPGVQPPSAPGSQPPQNARDARAQAKAERAYRKAKRPWPLRHWFITSAGVIIIIIIIAVIASNSGGSGGGNSTTDIKAAPCAAPYLDKQVNNDRCANASGTVTMSGLAVTAKPLQVETDSLGSKGVCSAVTINNVSSGSQDYNVLDFKVQTPSGDVATSSTLNFAQTLDSGTLVPGGVKTGQVCSDYSGTGQYVLIYKPNPFESTRGIWLFHV
jgi:hypothetical protein